MVKANNHPLVRDLRRLLDKHGLDGAVLVAITKDGRPMAASAGADIAKCNALGPVLEEDGVSILKYEIDVALMDIKRSN